MPVIEELLGLGISGYPTVGVDVDPDEVTVDYRMIGATGRVYLTGVESEVRAAAEAAEQALAAT